MKNTTLIINHTNIKITGLSCSLSLQNMKNVGMSDKIFEVSNKTVIIIIVHNYDSLGLENNIFNRIQRKNICLAEQNPGLSTIKPLFFWNRSIQSFQLSPFLCSIKSLFTLFWVTQHCTLYTLKYSFRTRPSIPYNKCFTTLSTVITIFFLSPLLSKMLSV